jgi:uncharacterized membrane protein
MPPGLAHCEFDDPLLTEDLIVYVICISYREQLVDGTFCVKSLLLVPTRRIS